MKKIVKSDVTENDVSKKDTIAEEITSIETTTNEEIVDELSNSDTKKNPDKKKRKKKSKLEFATSHYSIGQTRDIYEILWVPRGQSISTMPSVNDYKPKYFHH